ncbi:MAG: hypothetical protein IEMM0008_0156 [bacterium]|nr:MAG: hypothetical protein IEMM0008_0156 [bacterium]
MNPLAQELNRILEQKAPSIYRSLSTMGKDLFFPKGILAQSQEAKAKGHKFNATLGIATEEGYPMYLPSIHKFIPDLDPKDVYPYAPAAGKPELRKAWHKKMFLDNPSLKGRIISQPIVTCGITHGLSLIGDLFLDPGDSVILADKFWGNYKLIYTTRYQSDILTYPLFSNEGQFDLKGFKDLLDRIGKKQKKLVILMNFPNNPTGYTPLPQEAEGIRDIIVSQAEKGNDIILVTDDAYFNLFFGDSIKESLFAYTTGLHKNILSVKLDGATKEDYAWGLRVGFITFGLGDEGQAEVVYPVLEKKVQGAIRSKLSNAPHLSQTLVLKALESPNYEQEGQNKYEILKKRALKVMDVSQRKKYQSAWSVYPFNSGYFMCLRLKNVDAEKARQHLLNEYGVGVISVDATDIRIAFSCVEESQMEELFDIMYQGVTDLS